MNCSKRAELKRGLKISVYPHPQKKRNHSPGQERSSVPSSLGETLPALSFPEAMLRRLEQMPARPFLSPLHLSLLTQQLHMKVIWLQQPRILIFKSAAPAMISHQLPGARKATDHNTFPVPFSILVARRMSHCKYNCNWDVSVGAFISLEMPSWN